MDTYARLTKRNALDSQDVPRTFADAIVVTRFFGCQFLWIDSLCIVQDGDDKREQIRRTADVFAASSLTIISADGDSPQYGLTGATPASPRASRQTIRDVGGLQFAVMTPDLPAVMAGLPWSKDGWRYQEAMFAKRVLVFTPSQVYYACKLKSFSEDMHFIPGRRPPTSQSQSEIQRHPLYRVSNRHAMLERREFQLPQHWFSYAPLVQEFSGRGFLNEADVLQAISSVLKSMTSSRMEKYIAALPTSIFEYSLLWHALEPQQRRSCSRQGRPYPSWSWIGWKGASRLLHWSVVPGHLFPTINDWMFLTPAPSQRREEPETAGADEANEGERVREYGENEVHLTFLPYRPEPVPITQEMPFQPTRWMVWDKIAQALRDTNPFFSDDPEYFLDLLADHREEVARAHPLIESGVLSFTTTGRVFTVDSTPLEWTYREFPLDKTACFRIRDGNTWIGTVQLPRGTAKDLLRSDRTDAELILISEVDVRAIIPPRSQATRLTDTPISQSSMTRIRTDRTPIVSTMGNTCSMWTSSNASTSFPGRRSA